MKPTLTPQEYKRLRDRIGAALSALRACQEFQECLETTDVIDAISRLEWDREQLYKCAPPKTKQWHLNKLLAGQPHG